MMDWLREHPLEEQEREAEEKYGTDIFELRMWAWEQYQTRFPGADFRPAMHEASVLVHWVVTGQVDGEAQEP